MAHDLETLADEAGPSSAGGRQLTLPSFGVTRWGMIVAGLVFVLVASQVLIRAWANAGSRTGSPRAEAPPG